MTIINMTPHTINFVGKDGNIVRSIEPSGIVARAASKREQIGTIDGIAVNRTAFGEVQGLPEAQENTIYVVSSITAQACPEREDVFIVDDAVRDESGRIVGCRALAHV